MVLISFLFVGVRNKNTDEGNDCDDVWELFEIDIFSVNLLQFVNISATSVVFSTTSISPFIFKILLIVCFTDSIPQFFLSLYSCLFFLYSR